MIVKYGMRKGRLATIPETDPLLRLYKRTFSVGRFEDTRVYVRTKRSWIPLKKSGDVTEHFRDWCVSVHLRGELTLGIAPPNENVFELQAPAYCQYLDIDVDLKSGQGGGSAIKEQAHRIEVLEGIFNGRGLITRSSSSGGIRYLLRLSRPYVLNDLSPAVEAFIRKQVETGRGRIEVFPKRGCNSRLPFSREYTVFSFHKGVALKKDWREELRLFLELEPVDDVLDEALRQYRAERAFSFGPQLQSAPMHKGPSRDSETLKLLREFAATNGLAKAGERDGYVVAWAWFFRARGFSQEQAIKQVHHLMETFHNGKSLTINSKTRAQVRRIHARTVRSIYDVKRKFYTWHHLKGKIPKDLRGFLLEDYLPCQSYRVRWLSNEQVKLAVQFAEANHPHLVSAVSDLYEKAAFKATPLSPDSPGMAPDGRICANLEFWKSEPRTLKLQNRVPGRKTYLPVVRNALVKAGYLSQLKNYSKGRHARIFAVIHPLNLGKPTELAVGT